MRTCSAATIGPAGATVGFRKLPDGSLRRAKSDAVVRLADALRRRIASDIASDQARKSAARKPEIVDRPVERSTAGHSLDGIENMLHALERGLRPPTP